MSNQIASDASRTANKALEIAKLAIKSDVLPHLTITYLPIIGIDYQIFILRNLNHGRAKINSIEPMSSYKFKGILGNEIEYPIELGYQSEAHFKFVPDVEIEPALHSLEFFKDLVLGTRILILFQDELERNYILHLHHSGNNVFEGTPSEVTGSLV